jgi:phenylalanyl-tRNA synthetase beta chain
MPTVIVDREELHGRLGWRCSDEEFDEKCFIYGIELDDVETDATTGRTRYHIALPANRTDLLCIEGLSRALSCFFSDKAVPVSSFK